MEIRAKLKRGRVKSFTGNPFPKKKKKKQEIPLKIQVCRVIPIKRVSNDGIGRSNGKKQQREIFAHPCSRILPNRDPAMEHNGLERRFVSFFRLSLGQPILPRATNFVNFEKTQTWHDPHPSNQCDSFEKKKEGKKGGRRSKSGGSEPLTRKTKIAIRRKLSSFPFLSRSSIIEFHFFFASRLNRIELRTFCLLFSTLLSFLGFSSL